MKNRPHPGLRSLDPQDRDLAARDGQTSLLRHQQFTVERADGPLRWTSTVSGLCLAMVCACVSGVQRARMQKDGCLSGRDSQLSRNEAGVVVTSGGGGVQTSTCHQGDQPKAQSRSQFDANPPPSQSGGPSNKVPAQHNHSLNLRKRP
jgi:hypothetical protein